MCDALRVSYMEARRHHDGVNRPPQCQHELSNLHDLNKVVVNVCGCSVAHIIHEGLKFDAKNVCWQDAAHLLFYEVPATRVSDLIFVLLSYGCRYTERLSKNHMQQIICRLISF